ncbi:tudor domain-containing 6-like [Salvelinus namaycush]|uniref:Tudor domain-containing 6-like n=1 Tax=Salvelinus namaycush TaxID=8040 RepID=A0A8U0PE97_SALNM|nr:tudor domain-containing 6-like [Salvelinus namaycush]
MCSIPGLPTPGSQVTVLITRVNLNPICSLVELWGNFDQERQHAYQQMRRGVQIPRQRFCESEGNPGDLCLAHLNVTWHRARIISRHGHHYNVFLIDEGRAHVATNNTLAWGKNDCFLLPPEVEFCVLANVSPLSHENKWTPTASDFLESLCGKTVNGMVQDVLMPDRTVLLYIPIINKHMYEVGFARKLPSDKFKQLVLLSLNLPKSQVSSTETLPPTVLHKQTDAGIEIEKFQQYFYPELLTDFIETVEVTEVINPHRIFCKLSVFSQELKKLSEQIDEYYEGRSTFCKARQTASGAPCAARGSNGKWYRSLLQQDIGSESAVEVLHVDNGKTDFVHVGDIRPLAAKFFRMPVVTYVCSLHGIEDRGIGWTADEIKYLKSVLLHKTVIAKFEYHNLSEGINCVTLYGDDNVNINKRFGVKERCLLESERPPPRVTEESFATDIQNRVHPLTTPHFPSATETVLNEHWFQVGSTLEVKVSCIESPAKFWCQIAQESTSLQILMQEMQYHYTSSPPQQIDGDICVALDHDNGMWYRARIVENDQSPHVDVRLIDYGQTRRVSLQDLRPLDPVFRRLKTQAFQCFLQNLNTPTSPVPADWSDAASSEFQKFVDSTADSNVGLKCTVHAVMRDTQGLVVNMVDIETPVQSACKLLVQKGVKTPAPLKSPPLSSAPPDTENFSLHNIEVGGKEKVWITSAKSVAHFYGQLERNSHVIDKLTKDVQYFCHQPLQSTNCLQSLETVCFAKYTDNQWYRGQIKATHPTLQVHFVDYGDTVTLSQSDILSCPVEAGSLMSVPVQAVLFGLFGVPEDVSQEVNRWFEKHATDLSFTITAVAKDSGGKLLVELYDGTTHINEMVREKLKEKPSVSQNQALDVYASSIVEPNYFWCQHANSEELYRISGIVQEFVNSALQDPVPMDTLIPRSPCLAFFAEDNQWYRAQIIRKTNDLFTVLFVDYGNESEIDLKAIRSIPPPLLESAPQAFLCSLAGVEHPEGAWDNNTVDGFYQLIVDKPLKVTVQNMYNNLESFTPQYQVKVECEEHVINDLMRSYLHCSDLHVHSKTECADELFSDIERSDREHNTLLQFWKLDIFLGQTLDVYASSIAGPGYFWCQYANSEELAEISKVCQLIGNSEHKDTVLMSTLSPGSLCLALFAEDEQWYRAQIVSKMDVISVVFVDYGNESETDLKSLKSVPPQLLEHPPQAFLCSLAEFENSEGSWDDNALDGFYELLADKLLKVTVQKMDNNNKLPIPQYQVKVECEKLIVNDFMKTCWRSSPTESQSGL